MTWAELEHDVRFIIGQGAQFNVTTALQRAENRFIERVPCTEAYQQISTVEQNGGTPTYLYSLASDFVEPYRIEYAGCQLDPWHRGLHASIYDTEHNLIVGTPTSFMITELKKLWLIPKPSFHSTINVWYKRKNTSTSGTSPIIPDDEHEALTYWAMYWYFTSQKQYQEAEYWKAKFDARVAEAEKKYIDLKFKQERVTDVLGDTDLSEIGVGDSGSLVFVDDEATVDKPIKETQERSDGTPATGDPLDMFNAGTQIVHTLTETDYDAVPNMIIENHCDWPLFIDKTKTTVASGIVTVYISIGSVGSATELDYTLVVLNA